MEKTKVVEIEANYGRLGILNFVGDNVVFDCSGEEYGPVEFPIEVLEQKLKEHKLKLKQDVG